MKCRSNRHFCSFSQYREPAAIKINPRQNFLTQKKCHQKNQQHQSAELTFLYLRPGEEKNPNFCYVKSILKVSKLKSAFMT